MDSPVGSGVRRLLILAVLGGGAVGVIVWQVIVKHGGSVRPGLVIMLAVSAALVVAVIVRAGWLQRSNTEPAVLDAAEAGAPQRSDQQRGGLERFEWLVGVAMRDPDRFEFVLRGRLRDLAENRLWTKYGLDPRTDPDRARQLVGESLWRLMTTPVPEVPSRAQLEQWVATIERL